MTPLERLDAELAAYAEREPQVQAWVDRGEPDELRAALRSAPAGPLSGFTLGVKDVIDTAAYHTERGAAQYRGRRAFADAACVALARAAGATVTGKTATAELAMLTPTVTTNPHDPTRTPGGSSSGSAAAVAAGMVRVALGTQTGGSVIRPAAFCGVAGFKPTLHAVPVSGVHPVAPSLDTVGYFASGTADLAALQLALSGTAAATAPVRPRVGVYRSHEWAAAGPDTGRAIDLAAAALRSAGAEVVDIDPLPALAPLGRRAVTVMLWEAARSFATERATAPELLSEGLRSLLAQGDATPVAHYGQAQRDAAQGRVAFDAAAEGFDGWLTPAVPGEAPGLESTGDPVFCRVWTLLGAPAVTVPVCRGASGLPVGVQLVGARWSDARLLALAGLLESVVAYC